MDYILRKIENNLELYDKGSYDYITSLRKRIEYSLYLCLGFLWKNLDHIHQDKLISIFSDLNNLSIGTTVSIICELDIYKEVLVNKKLANIMKEYPAIRNQKIGHGYEMGDAIASSLTPLYNSLVDNTPLLKEECDIIVIRSYDPEFDKYVGIRIPSNKNGEGKRWSCPAELFATKETLFPRTYIFFRDKYHKISPFVFLDDNTLEPFVFSSLTEKIVGKTKLSPLFPSFSSVNKVEYRFEELINLSKSDGSRQISQSNGTIMNYFKPNYSNYVDVGFQKLIRNFLYKNRAYVTATIWGHGGMGKTACVQKMCFDLFNDSCKQFSYIVFITAKDRVYNAKTGNLDTYSGNIRHYSEVIETIAKTVFDFTIDESMIEEYEQKISNFEDTLLIVIDDYETFEDSEKAKISRFLSTLNARYHKAIITTRNNRFVIGEPIPSNELDINQTKQFVEAVIQGEYEDHQTSMEILLADSATLSSIYEATSGRPIFIYQFIHIYVQKGYQDDLIKGIRTSKNAQEFLYGRIIQYLSKNAQYLFATISVIVDDDLRFNFDVLEHIISKIITEKDQFGVALKEILDQKVIERVNDVYGRVYSLELFDIMSVQYAKYPSDYRDTVRNLLDSIGGKDIKGGIIEAMLEQADKSRTFGNEQETVEKYRRVLNASKCPPDVRKNALKHLADYLSNTRLNPMLAISSVKEYLPRFPDDADIYTLYIYLLWSQNIEEKEKAVNNIRSFFSNPIHKKTSPDYLIFFALSTGYCIDFDLQYRHYTEDKLRKNQYSRTFNEYGRELFDFIKKNKYLKGKPALYHNIRVALIQTIKLCYALSAYDNKMNMVQYGLEICAWMRNTNLVEPFLSQINRWENELNKLTNRQQTGRNFVGDTPLLQMESGLDSLEREIESVWTESGQHYTGDIVEVKITRIMDFGAFAQIDNSVTGLIHISEIDNRYIEDIYSEFAVGEIYSARIISIEENKVALSTTGLR